MAETKIEREQKILATEMNLQYVKENLYAKLLRSRDIPYKTRLTTCDSQNIKQSNLTPT